ncbi:MAG TPA: outer membrane protein assembly factor BamC [Burkholderiales bacterium]|nr:outer membrane protein assembly factor BamC [Burkholderiales bacterium]
MAVAATTLCLVACASIDDMLDSKVDYKSQAKGKTMPTLEVPPDLTSPARDNRYVVPETGRTSATLSGYQAERKEQSRAGNTQVLPQVEQMRVERAGSERWLVVANETPERLWPMVKDFWQENGFLIKTELPEAGVMETDWAENRAKVPGGVLRDTFTKFLDQVYSTSERDKFRTRLERTADGKGSEVYISHRGMNEVYTSPRGVAGENAQTVWSPREPDPGLEAEFLRRLMVRLGYQAERAKDLVAASPQSQRAEIRKGIDGAELLQVNEPFDRAWRRVGLVLDRVGFTVEDRDRQKGLYFVRYADPESEMAIKDRDRGFFGKLFGGESKLKAEQYRVQVRQADENSQVQVLNKDGATENTKTTQRILTLLHEQLK